MSKFFLWKLSNSKSDRASIS